MNGNSNGIWQGIAVGSLAMSVLALILSIVVAGPQGAAGPEGPQGDDGLQGPSGGDISRPAMVMGTASVKTCDNDTSATVVVTHANFGDQTANGVVANIYASRPIQGQFSVRVSEQKLLGDVAPYSVDTLEWIVTTGFYCDADMQAWVTYNWS